MNSSRSRSVSSFDMRSMDVFTEVVVDASKVGGAKHPVRKAVKKTKTIVFTKSGAFGV